MNAVQLSAVADAHVTYLTPLIRALRPRPRLNVSTWADTHRQLSPKASAEPGPWKTDRTPYLREIQDCLSSTSPVHRVTIMKSTQVGGTEVCLNWIGYTIDHHPGPMLVVVPTIEVRKRWAKQRLVPLLTETEVLRRHIDARRKRDTANAEDVKDFPGGMLVLSGANAPASLGSMPIRDVIADELDRFPWEVGKEGDPLGLVEQRQSTFRRRKLLLISTPTIRGASRIEAEYLASDQRRYHVPCPHCGESLILTWGQLQWDRALHHAWYVCEHCGASIEESSKPDMLANGKWIPGNPDAPDGVRGYHINALYAPLGLGHSWIELARQWIEAQDDRPKLVRFINTVLGETWEEKSSSVKASALEDRAEPYPLRHAPAGVLLITAGIDVQDDRLAIQIDGWGRNETDWTLDYTEIPGNPETPALWAHLAEILNTPIEHALYGSLRIAASAVDTGGHHTHAAYQFVRSRPATRVMAIKGANRPGRAILGTRPALQDVRANGSIIKRGVKLWMVGTDTAKHMLFGRLSADNDLPLDQRRVHFSEDLPSDYYRMLTAEVFDPRKNKWVLRRGQKRNEALDTKIYSYVAACHPELRIDKLSATDWDRLEAQIKATSAKQSAPPAQSTPRLPTPKTPRNPGFGKEDWIL